MKKSFKVIKNITGISCPFFGISWNPSKSDRNKIKSFLIFLEDRRVLYNPFHKEVVPWVAESIIEIRKKITDFIPDFDEDSEVVDILQMMRSSCRRYLDRTYKYQNQYSLNQILIENLFELRTVFGICIAKLSMMYGINLSEELLDIIPLTNDEDKKNYELNKINQKLIAK